MEFIIFKRCDVNENSNARQTNHRLNTKLHLEQTQIECGRLHKYRRFYCSFYLHWPIRSSTLFVCNCSHIFSIILCLLCTGGFQHYALLLKSFHFNLQCIAVYSISCKNLWHKNRIAVIRTNETKHQNGNTRSNNSVWNTKWIDGSSVLLTCWLKIVAFHRPMKDLYRKRRLITRFRFSCSLSWKDLQFRPGICSFGTVSKCRMNV